MIDRLATSLNASRVCALVLGVVLALTTAACSRLTVDGHGLDGTRWVAVSIAGAAPVAGFEPTVEFDDGRVSGSGGCNGYVGQDQVRYTNGHLELGEMLMTTGACLGPQGEDLPLMPLEDDFWTVLNAADRIGFRNAELVIAGPAGELVFQRRP